MAIPQYQQGKDVKSLNEELTKINKSLDKVKEAETKLHQIKALLELLNNPKDKNEQKTAKYYSSLVFQAYEDFENIFVKGIFPSLQHVSFKSDPVAFRNFSAREKFNNSLEVYKDDLKVVYKDSVSFQDLRSFQEVFQDSKKALFEFSYEFLTRVLDFIAIKEKLLIVRYEKAADFAELPEMFYISCIRLDLMTITLTFRKIRSPLNKYGSQKNGIGNQESEKAGAERDRVGLFNVVYSNIFDQPKDRLKLNNGNSENLNIIWKTSLDDADVKSLLQVLKENYSRISLPCIYPNMAVYQRFSSFMFERIEKISNHFHTQRDDKILENILNYVLKIHPEEFSFSINGKCILCNKRFAMDSKFQRLLPPISVKFEKNEKAATAHLGCRKRLETVKGDGPQVVINIETTPDFL